MTTVYTSQLAAGDSNAAGTHVFIVGVGEYPCLLGGSGRLLEPSLGLKQLSSPPVSAAALATWFLGRECLSLATVGFHNPSAPLATLEMLVSPSQTYIRPDGTQMLVEAATRANIAQGFERWLERAAAHDANVAVFYFCGHGVMGADDYLLPSDFGAVNRHNPWTDAIDITQTARAMRRLAGGALYFFIDACRQGAREALNPGASPSALAPVKFKDQVRSFTRLILWAAGEGEAAFGAAEKTSRFTQALIGALSGYEGEVAPDGKSWMVTGSLLGHAVSAILETANKSLEREKHQHVEQQLIGSQPFHFETAPPRQIAVGIPSSWSVGPEVRQLLATRGVSDTLPDRDFEALAEQLEAKNLQVKALQKEVNEWTQLYGDLRRKIETQPSSKLAQRALELLIAGRWEEATAAYDELKLSDLSETGWGVIFAVDADPKLRDALRPLLDLRQQQATQKYPDRYREFSGSSGYRPGDTSWEFLGRQGVNPTASDWSRVPYNLLIVGDPGTIPFEFAYQLSKVYAVGRVYFSGQDDYAVYARSVVNAEAGEVALPRRVIVFAPRHAEDTATETTAHQFVAPLVRSLIARQSDWKVRTWQREATKAELASLLGGEQTAPLLLFVGHGVTFADEDPGHVGRQGALLCSDWQYFTQISEEQMFAAADIAPDARLLGSIAFLVGPYTGGTPERDGLTDQTSSDLPARKASLSPLPLHLLSHPAGGALAVVGHVGNTWSSGFAGAKGNQDVEMFSQILQRLMRGASLGAAMRPLFQRYADYAAQIAEQIEFGRQISPRLQETMQDLRGYLILGDPAVRAMTAEAEDRKAGATVNAADEFHEPSGLITVQAGAAADLAEAGWGVIFPTDADERVRKALGELLGHRRQQASSHQGSFYQEFYADRGYQPGETAESFLTRQSWQLRTTGSRLPRFLLIVGSPKSMSYEFQTQLATRHAVGRLHFEDLKAYRHYARSVVVAETGSVQLPRQVAFFSPWYPNDVRSEIAANGIVLPLAEKLEKEAPDWRVRKLIGERATKVQIKRLIGGDEMPAVLFVVTRSANGMLCCQDYPANHLHKFTGESDVSRYSAEDISTQNRLTGLVVLLFTSFGIGKDSHLAPLPQALLGHECGGALAVVGVAEDLMLFPNNVFVKMEYFRPPLDSQHEFLRRLTKGERLGAAMDALRFDPAVSAPWLLLGDPAIHLSA